MTTRVLTVTRDDWIRFVTQTHLLAIHTQGPGTSATTRVLCHALKVYHLTSPNTTTRDPNLYLGRW